jgi:excisionase family DNA binding protein
MTTTTAHDSPQSRARNAAPTSVPTEESTDGFSSGSDRHESDAPHRLEPTPTGSDRLVFSVAEAGELLGLSRAFAYELVVRGELPVIRFGRRIVVPKAALLELLGSASLDG